MAAGSAISSRCAGNPASSIEGVALFVVRVAGKPISDGEVGAGLFPPGAGRSGRSNASSDSADSCFDASPAVIFGAEGLRAGATPVTVPANDLLAAAVGAAVGAWAKADGEGAGPDEVTGAMAWGRLTVKLVPHFGQRIPSPVAGTRRSSTWYGAWQPGHSTLNMVWEPLSYQENEHLSRPQGRLACAGACAPVLGIPSHWATLLTQYRTGDGIRGPRRSQIVVGPPAMRQRIFAVIGVVIAALLVLFVVKGGKLNKPAAAEAVSIKPAPAAAPPTPVAVPQAPTSSASPVGSVLAALLKDGVVPNLPDNAPKHVTFGVVLLSYAGAQGTGADARTKTAALERAQTLMSQATTDFGEAVKKGDAGSVANAGRISRGVLEPTLEYVLFTLKKGDVFPEPLDTPRGYWILRRID